jgi:hypothetical protein
MEFPIVVQKFNKELDYEYYLEDISGIMARFINWEINSDANEDEDDLKLNKKAKDYLIKFIRSYRIPVVSGGTIRNMRQYVYGKYVGKLGSYIVDEFSGLFNNNINTCVNITEHMISKIYDTISPNYAIPDDFNREQYIMDIKTLTQKILKKNTILSIIYAAYIDDMKTVLTPNTSEHKLKIDTMEINGSQIIIDMIGEITTKISILSISPESSYVANIINMYI